MWYVKITVIVLVVKGVTAPPPLRLTIDCGSDEDISENSSFISDSNINGFDVNSFCRFIHNSIPKAVKDGKVIIKQEPDYDYDYDQSPFGDTLVPVAVAPPQGFPIPRIDLPKIKFKRLKIPKIGVPRLVPSDRTDIDPPRIRNVMAIPSYREKIQEQSSAERTEKLKKGVQKMLHFVKILGQVDQYLSERMRIIVDKLSKTFADD